MTILPTGRPYFVTQCVSQKYAYLDPFQNIPTNEINQLFPGQYTVLLDAKQNKLSPLVQNGSPKIGIRIPNHSFPIQVIKLLKKPIITTSINRHGHEALNDLTQVEIDFPNIDIFEDSDHSPSRGSTIIDFCTSPPIIIRQGDAPYPL